MSPEVLACWNCITERVRSGQAACDAAHAWAQAHDQGAAAAEALQLWEATARCDASSEPDDKKLDAAVRRLKKRL